jgi:hypothetical protein
MYIYIQSYMINHYICTTYQNHWTIFDLQSVCFTEKARCDMQGPGPCTKMSLRSQKTNGSGEPYIFCSDDSLISRISKLVTCRVGSNAQQWRMQSFHLRGHSAAPGRDFARACAGDGSASATHVGSSCWIVKTLVWPWIVNEWCTITYNYKASFETTFKGMVSEPLYPSPPCS